MVGTAPLGSLAAVLLPDLQVALCVSSQTLAKVSRLQKLVATDGRRPLLAPLRHPSPLGQLLKD